MKISSKILKLAQSLKKLAYDVPLNQTQQETLQFFQKGLKGLIQSLRIPEEKNEFKTLYRRLFAETIPERFLLPYGIIGSGIKSPIDIENSFKVLLVNELSEVVSNKIKQILDVFPNFKNADGILNFLEINENDKKLIKKLLFTPEIMEYQVVAPINETRKEMRRREREEEAKRKFEELF